MADEADIANSLIEGALSRAIDQLRKSTSQATVSTKTCAECGDDIHEERRKLGFKLCIGCAQEAERRKSLYGEG